MAPLLGGLEALAEAYTGITGAKAPRAGGLEQGVSEGLAGKQSWAGSPSPALNQRALLYLTLAMPQFPLLQHEDIVKPTLWMF